MSCHVSRNCVCASSLSCCCQHLRAECRGWHFRLSHAFRPRRRRGVTLQTLPRRVHCCTVHLLLHILVCRVICDRTRAELLSQSRAAVELLYQGDIVVGLGGTSCLARYIVSVGFDSHRGDSPRVTLLLPLTLCNHYRVAVALLRSEVRVRSTHRPAKRRATRSS